MRTELKYWSGIVGLIVFIFSALALVTEFGGRQFRQWFGDHLAISDMSSTDKLRVWNVTDGDIWLKRIDIVGNNDGEEYGYNFGVILSSVIKPKAAADIDIPTLMKEQWRGTWQEIVSQEVGDFVSPLSDAETKLFKSHDLDVIKRYPPDFLYKDGPEFAQQEAIFGDKIFTFGCSMKITYASTFNTGNQHFEIPCVGMLRHVKKAPGVVRLPGIDWRGYLGQADP